MKKIKAFSLAEMMVVMLIMTIILAASIPILSKRAKVKAAAAANVILPVKNVGDTCTTGSIAIASDGTVLTCQGGTFKKPSSGGAGDSLYIYNYNSSSLVNSCPVGYTDAGVGASGVSATNYVYTRTCYNSNQSCTSLYLYNYTNSFIPSCPAGYTDAGVGVSGGIGGSYNMSTRSCYKCS